MRSRSGGVLLAAFLIVPIVELALAIQVGRWIGTVPTILLLIFESLLGAWIVRREGAAAWRSLTESLQSGRPPSRELADAALVLVGGTLLLTPGFLTDVLGFVLVIPATRPPARRLLTVLLRRSLLRRLAAAQAAAARADGDRRTYSNGYSGGPVIRGDVITDDDLGDPPRHRPEEPPRV